MKGDQATGCSCSALCSAQKEIQREFDRSTCSDEVHQVSEQMAAHRHHRILRMCHVKLKKTKMC